MIMLRLEFKPNERSRVWQKSSLRMRPEGRLNMEQTAKALLVQEGWHEWRIVEEEV